MALLVMWPVLLPANSDFGRSSVLPGVWGRPGYPRRRGSQAAAQPEVGTGHQHCNCGQGPEREPVVEQKPGCHPLLGRGAYRPGNIERDRSRTTADSSHPGAPQRPARLPDGAIHRRMSSTRGLSGQALGVSGWWRNIGRGRSVPPCLCLLTPRCKDQQRGIFIR